MWKNEYVVKHFVFHAVFLQNISLSYNVVTL